MTEDEEMGGGGGLKSRKNAVWVSYLQWEVGMTHHP